MRTRMVMVVMVMVLTGLVGCSSGPSSEDAGAKDLGVADLSTADQAAPDVLTGTKLAGGANLVVLGVTDDDLAVYLDLKSNLLAVPLSGGAPVTIDTGSGADLIRGKTVFSWSGYDQTSNVGALTVYTAATGPISLADSSVGNTAAASPDGKYIAWTGNVDATGTTASVFVGTPDGKTKMEVLTNRSADPGCQLPMAWWKDVFVVASCAPAGDAGVGAATIDLIDPQSFAVTELANDVRPFFSRDDAGQRLFTIGSDGSGQLRVRGQTTATVIDSGVSDGFLLPDGSAVVYTTMSGALLRWTVQGAAKTTLVAANVSGFTGISSSLAFVLYYQQLDQAGSLSDVHLASTTAANQTPVTLVDSPVGSVFGDAFTSDEKFALYYGDVDTNDFSGTLDARGTGAGGQKREIAQRVWFSLAGTGSKVVYDDNYVAVSGGGRADLKVLDLAGTAAPTVIATAAEEYFSLNKARDRVVFSTSAQEGKEGVYVAPIP